MEGYIKIFRQITENKHYLSEPFTRVQAWIDLLLLANHKHTVLRIKGMPIEIERGQLARSIKGLAERWQWSQGKVDRYINELQTERQIVSKNLGVTTLISILNYDFYQSDGDVSGKRTVTKRRTDGEQTGTDNNVKNNTTSKEVVYTDEQKENFAKFEKFISEEAKDVAKMREPFTIEQYLKITEKYDKKLVAQVIREMDNNLILLKKYKSAYRTCSNWCKSKLNSLK